jgi:hypothetical protein
MGGSWKGGQGSGPWRRFPISVSPAASAATALCFDTCALLQARPSAWRGPGARSRRGAMGRRAAPGLRGPSRASLRALRRPARGLPGVRLPRRGRLPERGPLLRASPGADPRRPLARRAGGTRSPRGHAAGAPIGPPARRRRRPARRARAPAARPGLPARALFGRSRVSSVAKVGRRLGFGATAPIERRPALPAPSGLKTLLQRSPIRRSRNQEGCRGSRLQTPGFR